MLLPDVETEIESEAALVRSAAGGDADAFAELFHRHYQMIYSYAYRLCLRQADAEDIAQDTFIKAARSLADYRSESAFANWLFRICTNTARDWARKQARRSRFETTAQEQDVAAESGTGFDDSLLEVALAKLSPEIRAAVVLVYYEGMNHGEAAAVLDCAETTVSWRIFRAKRTLRTLLIRHE